MSGVFENVFIMHDIWLYKIHVLFFSHSEGFVDTVDIL